MPASANDRSGGELVHRSCRRSAVLHPGAAVARRRRPRRVLKHGDTFAVFDASATCSARRWASRTGLLRGTRATCRGWSCDRGVDGRCCSARRSKEDNLDVYRRPHQPRRLSADGRIVAAQGTLHVVAHQLLCARASLHERVRAHATTAPSPSSSTLSLHFAPTSPTSSRCAAPSASAAAGRSSAGLGRERRRAALRRASTACVRRTPLRFEPERRARQRRASPSSS